MNKFKVGDRVRVSDKELQQLMKYLIMIILAL